MQKYLSPRKIAEYFKSSDPDTAITESFIRRLIREGEIPYLKKGKHFVTTVECVLNYLNSKLGGELNANV